MENTTDLLSSKMLNSVIVYFLHCLMLYIELTHSIAHVKVNLYRYVPFSFQFSYVCMQDASKNPNLKYIIGDAVLAGVFLYLSA